MALYLDCIQDLSPRALPDLLVDRPASTLGLPERDRHHVLDDVLHGGAAATRPKLAQEQAILEPAPERLQPERRQRAGVGEYAVAVAPIGSTARALVESDRIAQHVRRAAAVVAVAEVEP